MRVALIGQGIALSKTPAMHEAEGRAQGLDYHYDLIDSNSPSFAALSLAELLQYAQNSGYRGVNITHPFKQQVLDHVDVQDDAVQRIGAANTVVFDGGQRVAYNTDYSGFKKAFALHMQGVAASRVLLLGAGGAGTAVALALLDSGVTSLAVFDTSAARAQALLDRYQVLRPNAKIVVQCFGDDFCLDAFDGLVNTTPMGMAAYPGSAIPLQGLRKQHWVADIVYFPLQTALLIEAARVGCHCMHGGAMAVYQAVEAFKLFTGREPQAARFEQCFAQLVSA